MTGTATFMRTDEQALLQSTVRELFESRASTGRVREVMDTEAGIDEVLWTELAAMGLLGLTIDEAHGGGGAGFVELSIVIEEAGRRLVPVPVLSSLVLGATVLQAAGTPQQCAQHLAAVARGTTRLALAHLDAAGRIASEPGVRATPDRASGDWVLDGAAGYVVDGHSAHLVITLATTDDGPQLFLVPGDAAGLQRSRLSVLDLTRPLAHLAYTGVRVGRDARLSGGSPRTAIDVGLTAGAVALACEQAGGTQAVLEATTVYARQRVQFGRAIGSFQAVKHRLAEMLVQSEAARSAAYHAARVCAAGDADELAIAAPLAKAYCSQVFEQAAADSIQVHGGVAFTWEHDAHLFLKRAKASKLLLGTPGHHRALLGDVLGL